MPAFQPYWGKPPNGMIGRTVETSASFETRYAPLSYPTEGREGIAMVANQRVVKKGQPS
jgi:hypothetical protein